MTKYQYEEGKTYLSESTPITVSRIPSGTYKISASSGSGVGDYDSAVIFTTSLGTQKLTMRPRKYGYVAVDIAINIEDPVTRCTYPETITVNGNTVVNSCAGFTPASGASGNFAMNSWDNHPLISGIRPISKNGSTWTHLNKDETTWASNSDAEDYFTEFPFQWLSITNDGTTIRIIFSDDDTQPDSNFQCYAHAKGCDNYENSDIENAVASANRASILNFNNNSYFANAFHIGCFGASGNSSGIYSKKAVTCVDNMEYANFWKGANARGNDYDCMSLQQWAYLQALFVLLYRSTDSQSAHSYGYVSANEYDTSNSALSTSAYGMSGSTDSARNSFFWINDPWGNIFNFIGGVWNRVGSSSKLYYWLPRQANSRAFNNGWDAVSVNATQDSLGTDTGLTGSTSYGYIIKVAGTNVGGFCPTSQRDYGNTYFFDEGRVNASTSGAMFPLINGRFNYESNAGLFYCNVNFFSTSSNSGYCARLSYRGGRT